MLLCGRNREIREKKTGCRSFCRRWRQTALRLRRRRRQQTEDDHKSTTEASVVKPRLSPESRGFRSPSTMGMHDELLCEAELPDSDVPLVSPLATNAFPYPRLYREKITKAVRPSTACV